MPDAEISAPLIRTLADALEVDSRVVSDNSQRKCFSLSEINQMAFAAREGTAIMMFLLLAMAATAAFAADPRMVTVPDQTPPLATAPAPAPRPSQPMIQGLERAPAVQPGAGQNGTEQAPLFVRVLPDPKTADEAEGERREREARAANEQGLTTYTRDLWLATIALALVALLQAALFLWQLVLLRRSVQDSAVAAAAAREAAAAARANADATKTNADTANRQLLLSQQPRLRISNVIFRLPAGSLAAPALFHPGNPVGGQLYVRNIGGSKATITESHCIVFWRKGSLPMERPYEGDAGNNFLGHPIVQPGVGATGIFNTLQPGSTAQVMGDEGTDVLQGKDWRIWVMGWIEFLDDLTIPRRVVFCREWTADGMGEGRLKPVDDRDYDRDQ
jgi:hypothetical protein